MASPATVQRPARTATGAPARTATGAPARTATSAPSPAANATPRLLDIAIAGGAMVVAALVSLLPDGNFLRAAVALPILLVAPGYLLLQAISHRPRHDMLHFLAAIGLSLPLVGLLALSTSLVPGGFTLGAIIVVTTLGCLTLGGVAYMRRAPQPA